MSETDMGSLVREGKIILQTMIYVILKGGEHPEQVDSSEVRGDILVCRKKTKDGREDELSFPLVNVLKILNQGTMKK